MGPVRTSQIIFLTCRAVLFLVTSYIYKNLIYIQGLCPIVTSARTGFARRVVVGCVSYKKEEEGLVLYQCL